MSTALEAFRQSFRLDDLTITTSEQWVWSVRPGQCTLGAGVLSVRQNVEQFSDLPPQAGSDLIEIVQLVESSLRSLYGYEKINYLMLMMVDPLVHFHVIPRYSEPIERHGRSWEDAGWPGPPNLKAEEVGDSVLLAIRDELKSAANSFAQSV